MKYIFYIFSISILFACKGKMTVTVDSKRNLGATESITLDTPAYVNSKNVQSYSLAGECIHKGRSILTESMFEASTKCGSDGRWSVSVDLSATSDGTHEIVVFYKSDRKRNLAVKSTGAQILTVPVIEGHEVTAEQFEELPVEVREQIEKNQMELSDTIQEAYKQIRVVQQETHGGHYSLSWKPV